MQQPTLNKELELLTKYQYIAGIDEAGRGPLAGPVVAACVILNPKKEEWHQQIRDSKKMTEKHREKSFEDIKKNALGFGIGEATCTEVDKINILQATFLAMQRAIADCAVKPNFILVDGNQNIPNIDIDQKIDIIFSPIRSSNSLFSNC